MVIPRQFVETFRVPINVLLGGAAEQHDRPLYTTARRNSSPAPTTLMEELLLARFVLAPLYGGPFRVFEQSTHFFRLKPARTLADTEPAKQLRRRRLATQLRSPRHLGEAQKSRGG